ncbi:MAG: alpha/beta fold hydrolase [Mycobacteriales bacterium]
MLRGRPPAAGPARARHGAHPGSPPRDRARRVPGGVARVDGRDVEYAEWGDPDGFPVVVLHGTPGSRLGRFSDPERLAATGMRQIGINRPGYGGSTRLPDRSVADVVTDVEAVVDALGVARFAVVGDSGGGPHALAVAAVLSERVARCRVTGCLAPYGIPAFFDGMDPHNVEEWELVVAGRGEAEVRRRVELMRARVVEDPATVYADLALTASDRRALSDDRAFAVRRESLAEALTTHHGWYDDDVAFSRAWGFEVTDVRVPVEVRYGRHDVFVPPTHGDWLAAALPDAVVTVWPDRGHLADPARVLTDYAELVAACR